MILQGRAGQLVFHNTSSSDDAFLGQGKLLKEQLKQIITDISQCVYKVDLETGEREESRKERYNYDNMIGKIIIINSETSVEDILHVFDMIFNWDMYVDSFHGIHNIHKDFPIPSKVLQDIWFASNDFDAHLGKNKSYRNYTSFSQYFKFNPGQENIVNEWIKTHVNEIRSYFEGVFWIESREDNSIPYTVMSVISAVLDCSQHHLG